MIKKLSALLLALLMVATALVGCGKKDEDDKGAYVMMYLSDLVYDLDPVNAYTNESALRIVSLMFDNLFVLDENGKVKEEYEMLSGVVGIHPRCAVGYYEPGHYCFVVVDGRQSHSIGMRMNELAQIFEDLGCTMAYNMDGGASAVMMFDQRIINRQSASRELGDILLITDSYFSAALQPQEVSE